MRARVTAFLCLALVCLSLNVAFAQMGMGGGMGGMGGGMGGMGGGMGGMGGGMGGMGGMCWVAREVYGAADPRWLVFRGWLLADAPTWLRDAYAAHGEVVAGWLRDRPVVKAVVRTLMDRVVAGRVAPPSGS